MGRAKEGGKEGRREGGGNETRNALVSLFSDKHFLIGSEITEEVGRRAGAQLCLCHNSSP